MIKVRSLASSIIWRRKMRWWCMLTDVLSLRIFTRPLQTLDPAIVFLKFVLCQVCLSFVDCHDDNMMMSYYYHCHGIIMHDDRMRVSGMWSSLSIDPIPVRFLTSNHSSCHFKTSSSNYLVDFVDLASPSGLPPPCSRWSERNWCHWYMIGGTFVCARVASMWSPYSSK